MFWCVAKTYTLFCEENDHVLQKNLFLGSNDDPDSHRIGASQ
jgi:hypothetical protein